MNEVYRTELYQEVDRLIKSHKMQLAHYTVENQLDEYPEILKDIEKLIEYTQNNNNISINVFYNVRYHLCRLEQFLRDMKQTTDDRNFQQTEIGQLLINARQWYHRGIYNYPNVINDIWKIITPVQPDTLRALDNGSYEASWWLPIPQMDIELLMRTPDVEVDIQPYERPEAPGSLAVQFSVNI